MEEIKFSVLIPVYNVEKYLKQCIDSVLAQNYNNLEIILVDDGSTDSSGSICDEYAKKDKRIKVIHKKNEGLLSARRTAIKVATGDFIAFLDSDDYWESTLLNTVLTAINKYDCDIVIFNCKKLYPDRIEYAEKLFDGEQVFEVDGKMELYKISIESNRLNNLVTKVVSKSIVDVDNDYLDMQDVSYGEDLLQSVPILIKAKKVVYIDKYLYCYRQQVGMTKSASASFLYSTIKVRARITELYEKTGVNLRNSIEKELYNYLEGFAKYVLYGYLDNPQKLKESLNYIFETDFYKMARKTAYNKQSLFNKSIICLVENRHYKLISFIAYALKQRNKLKELRKK